MLLCYKLGPDYYYSKAIGLTDEIHQNKEIRIDNWRPDIGPRVINVEKETYRYLVGIRGTTDSGWDWESAYLYSEAETNDVTDNRLSNSLLEAGLNDSTANAIIYFHLM